MKIILSWLTHHYLNFSLRELEEIDFRDCGSLECLQFKMRATIGKEGKLSQILKQFKHLSPDAKIKMRQKINSAKENLELKYEQRIKELT